MWLLYKKVIVFNIKGKTPRGKNRLKISVNWDETSLMNNLIILVGILIGPIAFEVLRDNIVFLTFVSRVKEKRIYFNLGGENHENYFLSI